MGRSQTTGAVVPIGRAVRRPADAPGPVGTPPRPVPGAAPTRTPVSVTAMTALRRPGRPGRSRGRASPRTPTIRAVVGDSTRAPGSPAPAGRTPAVSTGRQAGPTSTAMVTGPARVAATRVG